MVKNTEIARMAGFLRCAAFGLLGFVLLLGAGSSLRADELSFCLNQLRRGSDDLDPRRIDSRKWDELYRIPFTAAERHKVEELRQKISSIATKTLVTWGEVANLLRYANYLHGNPPESVHDCGYVASLPSYISKFSLLVSSNHVFVYLGPWDAQRARGAFKSFSRTVDLLSGTVYANLLSPLTDNKLSPFAPKRIRAVRRELAFMEAFAGKYFLSGLSAWQTVLLAANNDKPEPYFVFQAELFYGDLRKANPRISRANAWSQILLSILDGLASILEGGFIHRDIKAANLLVSSDLDRAVFTDFGLAVTADARFASQIAGTSGHIAPELCERKYLGYQPLLETRLDAERAELFSLGVAFFDLLVGKHPYLDAIIALNKLFLGKARKITPAPEEMEAALDNLTSLYVDLALKDHPPLIELIVAMLNPRPSERITLPVARARALEL